MISKGVLQVFIHSIAFAFILVNLICSASSRIRLFKTPVDVILSLSTKVTCLAPRDNASIDKMPLPAKRSRQVALLISCINQLKIVSLMRSLVGRISF